MYYVSMTDTFMSGWGQAKGKLNKLVISCHNLEQAKAIVKAAKIREEMEDIRINDVFPKYREDEVVTSELGWERLGYRWRRFY